VNLNVIEGYVEVSGKKPVLITALHGFGTDRFKDIVGKIKELGLEYAFSELIPSRSAVDFLTWEIAFKAAIATNSWAVLPTISKVDHVDGLNIPYYNLNKEYGRKTPLWRRIEQLVNEGKIKYIIDVHGMKNISVWPDVCLSTNGYSSVSRNVLEKIVEKLRKRGLRVSVDKPFKGGALIKYFGKPPKTEALGIELKRNLRFFGSKAPEIIIEVVNTFLA